MNKKENYNVSDKVLIINRGNSENLGDQAINFTLTQLLKSKYEHVAFEDLIESNHVSGGYLKKANLLKNRELKSQTLLKTIIIRIIWFFNNIKRVKLASNAKYDLVFIGGGQLLNSNVKFPLSIATWIYFLSKNRKTKIVLFSIGVDTKFNTVDKILLRKVLKKCSDIYVRDLSSKDSIFKNFGLSSTVIPDVVFAIRDYIPIKSTKENRVLINPTTKARYNKHKSNEQLIAESDYWIDLINRYLNQGFDVRLFYTTSQDLFSCIELQEEFKNRFNTTVVIEQIENLTDLISTIEKSKIIVSQRMHALILGYVYDCVLEPIKISEKVSSFESMYVLDNYFINKDGIRSAIYNAIDYLFIDCFEL